MTPPIVKRYLIAFEKYKWIGLAGFSLAVIGSTVVAMLPDPPPVYIATGQLNYTGPTVSFSQTGSEIQQQGRELTNATLLSNPVIEAVAAKMRIKPTTIAKNISIKMPGKDKLGKPTSTTIILGYQDQDGNRARDVLLGLMQEMVKLSGEINTSRLTAIIEKLNERLPQIKKSLQIAEQKLEKYDRLERPAILAAENGSLLSGITSSLNQQRQIRFAIAGIKAQINSLERKLGLGVNQAYVASALSADPIIANLRSQIYQVESQIAFLRKDLRPQHPTMVQLQRQKAASEELLQARAYEVLGGAGMAAPLQGDLTGIRTQSSLDPTRQGLANQMVALQTQQETLEQQLNQQIQQEAKLRQEYAVIPNKQLERSRLEQAVALEKAIYNQIQAKLTDAKTAEAETVSSLSISSPPISEAKAVKPKNIPVTIAIGSFMGIVVGGGVIFLLGSLEGIFKTREDIRDSLKEREVALLGELPIMPLDDFHTDGVPVILDSDSPYLEFYERFRSNLRRIGGKDFKVLLITSISSREGKTVSAYNLGIASARAGKRTLIIETDLRSPSRAAFLNVNLDEDTALEPLQYYSNLSECIRIVPDIENLYIIPSAGPVLHSAAIIESSEIKRLMEDVRERYDLVILDTSSLSFSNDPLLLQSYSDGMVLVTRPNYTQENLLGETIDQLMNYEINLLGAIINAADIPVQIAEPVFESLEDIIIPTQDAELEIVPSPEVPIAAHRK
ncbi:tyrosine-protein kinase domain-containing protein [Anabaena sp. UHCC 0204]|uniref:GumC family protein n=1 Tax=Anabaena sp. UHCC 0204 TaxID=2590009 RepID=UPI0014470DD5|nr:tyrosine-protein kinase domain-containing protein [Anabaena sp. UHCC 0204]MTJ10012.1 AAA family ATPase [Anabaena sp. UHCC 0204]